MKKGVFLLSFLLIVMISKGQSFKFAFVSDTHIGSLTAEEDLRRTVRDINTDKSISFVVLTGDITEYLLTRYNG